MSLNNHIKPDFQQYQVRCTDDMMQENKVTKNKVYMVLGKLFGFLIIKNDKGELDKISENRFEEMK